MLETFLMLTDHFLFSNGPQQDRILLTRTGRFIFISQMSLSGELWTGSGLDINQYWEQRDACDQSNLLVGCFNNEYASSWLTGRFSKRSLILIGWKESIWNPFSVFSTSLIPRRRTQISGTNRKFSFCRSLNNKQGYCMAGWWASYFAV